ncbi:hypothetical protein MHYP_G00076500 [Metynnis hypsauchen]
MFPAHWVDVARMSQLNPTDKPCPDSDTPHVWTNGYSRVIFKPQNANPVMRIPPLTEQWVESCGLQCRELWAEVVVCIVWDHTRSGR